MSKHVRRTVESVLEVTVTKAPVVKVVVVTYPVAAYSHTESTLY